MVDSVLFLDSLLQAMQYLHLLLMQQCVCVWVGEDTVAAVGMSALRPGSPAHCGRIHWELGGVEPNMGMRQSITTTVSTSLCARMKTMVV